MFTLLLLLVQLRFFAKVKFFLSWWAHSFPVAAITIASFLMYQTTQQPGFKVIGVALLVALSLLILGLAIRTLIAIKYAQICVEE